MIKDNIFRIITLAIIIIILILNAYRIPGCSNNEEIKAKFEYGSNEADEDEPVYRVENTKEVSEGSKMVDLKFKIKGEGEVIISGDYIAERVIAIDGIHDFTLEAPKDSKVYIKWVSYDGSNMDINIECGLMDSIVRYCPKGEMDFKAKQCFISSLLPNFVK